MGDTWLIPAWEALSLLSLSGINEHPPADAIRPCDHELGSDVLSVAAAAQSCVIHWQKCLCVLFPAGGVRSKSVVVFFFTFFFVISPDCRRSVDMIPCKYILSSTKLRPSGCICCW